MARLSAPQALADGLVDALPAAGVVVLLAAVKAQKRRDVASRPNAGHLLRVQEHAVGDDLEVALGVTMDDVPEWGVEHRLAAQEGVEIGPLPLAGLDYCLDILQGELPRRAFAGDWSIFRPIGAAFSRGVVREHGPVPFRP